MDPIADLIALSPTADRLQAGPVRRPAAADGDAALRQAAQSLEQSFLAEMLKLSGVAKPPEVGGGGPGEEAFAGFLADAYAAELAAAGGLGLADDIFAALQTRATEGQ